MANFLAVNPQQHQLHFVPSSAGSPPTPSNFPLSRSNSKLSRVSGSRSPSFSVSLINPISLPSRLVADPVSNRPLSCNTNPHIPRCVSRFRSLTGSSSHPPASATRVCTKTPSTPSSSSAIIFRPFMRIRSRRLSDSSLTDLSPPTIDSDLDFGLSHPLHDSSTNPDIPTTQSSLKVTTSDSHLPQILPPKSSGPPSPPHSSLLSCRAPPPEINSSNTHIFPSLRPTEHHKSSQTHFHTLDGARATASSICSRMLSSSKLISTEKPNRQSKSTSQERIQMAVRHKDSLSSLNNTVTTAQQENCQTEVEEMESIRSPPKALWVDTGRAAKMPSTYSPYGGSHSGNSTSSPGLFSTSTFSHRPSGESERGLNSATHSPRRCPAPPPIKVPKLRAARVAIAADGDGSPPPMVAANVSRHRATGSESNVAKDRRHAGVEWPLLTRHGSLSIFAPRLVSQPMVAHHEPATLGSDVFEDLAGSPHPAKVHISVSASSKQTHSPSRAHLADNGASEQIQYQTPPLSISRHSRCLNSLGAAKTRTSPSRSPSARSGSRASTPSSAVDAQIVSVSHRRTNTDLQGDPSTSFDLPKRISLAPAPNQSLIEMPRSIAVPKIIPLPEIASSSNVEGRARHLSTLSHNSNLLPETPCLHRYPSPDVDIQRQGRADSSASFDVRNLPFTLDGSDEHPMPRMATTPPPQNFSSTIAQSIAIPQLPPMPAIDRITPLNSTCRAAHPSTNLHQEDYAAQGSLRTVGSNLSNGSSVVTNQCRIPVFTPDSSTESTYSIHSGGCSPEYSCPRSRSADDLTVPLSHPSPIKRGSRPRSMSDRGPDRPATLLELASGTLDHEKHLSHIDEQKADKQSIPLPPNSGSLGKVQPFPWVTQSLDYLERLGTSEQAQLIRQALAIYPNESHRFVVGDTSKLVREVHECPKRIQDLRANYLSDIARREKLLKRHIMTLRAFNGDEGARFGDTLLKAISQGDEGVSELFSLVNYTSHVERTCEAHWRAAATVEMRKLKATEEKLAAADATIQQLEDNRLRDKARIEKLEEQLRCALQRAEAESSPTLRQDTIDHANIATSNQTQTTVAPATLPTSNASQIASLNTRPTPNLPRAPLRPLNPISKNNPTFSTEASQNLGVSSTTPKIPASRLRPFGHRPGTANSVDHIQDLPSSSSSARLFERPRVVPRLPVGVPEPEDPKSINISTSNVPEISHRPEILKTHKRPAMQIGLSARSLFTGNKWRKPSEVAVSSNLAPPVSHLDYTTGNQFATWSPDRASRPHQESLNTLFKPLSKPEKIVKATPVPQLRHPNQSTTFPQVPPTQAQLSPPPPPPPAQASLPLPSEGNGLRRQPNRLRSDKPVSNNLTSITLSQLGSLDIAHMLTGLNTPT
ncbi:uncharacterized protein MELLADRAFT_107122 [Melampsora larici-populina 98AG31]|uniref:Uncharacterized protein n=1 Tax=Melampsora larici-populina (strain 98AG31 / pathotype 3-4-7) TaxID=747676 RepID=F4RNR5_MELLP|nr:uncharacterized protein MELLADRAFT_107122 [Melampsora larici-populina 98AG31]EGG06031.1 hypothetical protein MELLADRAFT_107122 [Melampsora larici-populina 98AG31]